MTKRTNRLVLQAIAATLIAAFFNSCSDKNDDSGITITTKNIVDNYYVPDKCEAYFNSIDQTIMMNWGFKTTSELLEIEYLTSQRFNYMADNKDEYKRYLEYADFFGDTVYSTTHKLSEIEWISVMPIISLDITTDKAFDTMHPDGSSINDLCTFVDKDNNIYSFIHDKDENGIPLYKGSYATNGDVPLHFSRQYNVESIKTNPIIMPGETNYIKFNKMPENKGIYNITINIQFGADPLTGQKIEVDPITVEMSF